MKKKQKLEGISIKDFVNYYLNGHHHCTNLKHQGLKSFRNPYVVGVSNDFALKYYEYVARQDLIVVIDDYNNPGTYINPNIIKNLIELEKCKEELKLLENIVCHSFKNINSLYLIWIDLVDRIKYLESVYARAYELLFIVGKDRLLKDIRRCAKKEAKPRYIPSSINSEVLDTSINLITVNEETNLELTELDNNKLISSSNDYQVTEKVNRQKQLKYYRKTS